VSGLKISLVSPSQDNKAVSMRHGPHPPVLNVQKVSKTVSIEQTFIAISQKGNVAKIELCEAKQAGTDRQSQNGIFPQFSARDFQIAIHPLTRVSIEFTT
jgi:uncharacterized protein YuzE